MTDTRRTIDAVWRIESPKLIATLARFTNDVSTAEDLAQDSLIAALEQWPESGIPDNPGAWLTAIGKRKAIDLLRRNQTLARKHEEIAHAQEQEVVEEFDEDSIEDDLLRLMFIACHPVLSQDARVALTLRLLGGLRTDEIARAFLVSERTIAQRIVRAKRSLTEAQVAFELPPAAERSARIESVLEVIYLIFNEGYSATSGETWIRPELCEDALRLGRILEGLAPQDAEVHGLVALMEIQSSRLRARIGSSGEPILLQDQDRSIWDQLSIRRGLSALDRALSNQPVGSYTLQAAIAACHARARRFDETDWEQIVSWYDALARLNPSAVVELNRAVAVSMASGPQAALDLVDRIARDQTLSEYHLLPSVRGDLLQKLGRIEEARAEFERAASLSRNAQERLLLLARATSLRTS